MKRYRNMALLNAVPAMGVSLVLLLIEIRHSV